MPSILDSSTSVLDQLGATIGRGVTASGGGNGSYQPVDYTDVFENIRQQQQEQADREYKLNKSRVDQEYKIAKLNAKTARERNEIDKWYNQQQLKLAQDRLSFDRDSFEKTHGLNQAKLGYDVLNMAAQLRGPASYFQASEFNRGVAQNPNSATFLNALKNNTQLSDFGAQYGVPDKETLGTLSAKLGTPVATTGAFNATANNSADDAYLSQIRSIGAAGAHKLGAGALEQLTDSEKKMLISGLDASGFDSANFLDQYRRSRIGQSAGGGGYAAA